MKRNLIVIILALFVLASHVDVGPASGGTAYAATSVESQKKGDKKEKKNPPGPPVVRGKEPKDSGKGKPPKKGKKN